ncbi:MAG: hypothetical protein PHZ09_11145 [Eubacteriales bacterium]|nr:hypothetical protein [Eubacteriales bacterium]
MLCVLTLLCTSCESVKGWDIGELERSEYAAVIPVTDIEMKTAADTVDPDTEKMDVTITNLSETEYGYGYEPRLEVQYGDEWYVIPTLGDISWIALWVTLAPGATNNESFPLREYYGTLPAGTYRFVKVLTADGDPLPAAAEFTVK